MNKRINNLIEKAHIQVVEETPDKDAKPGQWVPASEDLMATRHFLITRRIAHMVIQEAIDVCLAQRDPQNLNYKPSEKFAEALKQHFGVK